MLGVAQMAAEAVTPVFGVPVVSGVPPVAAANHWIWLPAEVAEIVSVPAPQREFGVPVGAAGIALTVATTDVRVADTQPCGVIV